MQDNSPEIMQRIREGLPWVQAAARQRVRTHGHLASVDELSSYGQLGLLKAARQFDPQRGASFRAFAKACIDTAMIDGCREQAPLSRRVHEKFDAARSDSARRLHEHVAGIAAAQIEGFLGKLGLDTQGEFVAISPKTSAEEASSRAENTARMRRCIASLPADQAYAVQRHHLEGEPIERVAAQLGLTRMQVRYLLGQARQALEKALRATE